jgi:hypothetical protein
MTDELRIDWRQRGRPEDIPLDIWNSAVAATSVLPHAYGWRKITESVARAILAERLKWVMPKHHDLADLSNDIN